MSFFSGEPFFLLFTVVMIGALIIGLLEKNLKVLDYVQKKSGANIILALKGYSMFSTFPLVGKYLSGVTSSATGICKYQWPQALTSLAVPNLLVSANNKLLKLWL